MPVSSDILIKRSMASAWLVLCIVLGGSSSGGIIANTLLQIAAGLIILPLIRHPSLMPSGRPARTLLVIWAAVAAAAIISLVPLPPALWTLLRGRGEIFDAYALLGMPAPWLPISLTPDATIAALLGLLVPGATFLLVHASPPAGRRAAIITLAIAAFVSVLFGVTQQVAGFRSDLYIYDNTSRGGAVGFFANRNHLATLCLMTMPFLAAFVVLVRGRRDRTQPGRWLPPLAALLLMVVGVLVVQSLAGWILLIPTAFACFLLSQRYRRGTLSRPLLIVATILVIFAVVVVIFVPLPTVDLAQVAGEANPRERRAIMALTWQAIEHFFPIGTGWGSFTQVYPHFEQSATITPTFINHAHNDYLELLLETGIVGVVALAAFLIWWAGRIRAAWRSGGDAIARAATVSIGVVMAHSFVDYPTRTAAIACVFALCCALTDATTQESQSRGSGGGRTRERRTGMIMLGVGMDPRKPRAAADRPGAPT